MALAATCMIAGTLAGQDNSTRQRDGLRVNTPDRFALINARIVVSPSRTIPSGMVVVDGRQIVQVSESIDPPSDAQVIDLKGRTLWPAIVDAYSEYEVQDDAIPSGSKYWNALVRPEVDVARMPCIDGDLHKSLRENGIGCRLLAPAGGILRGQSCLVLSLDEDVNACVIKPQVAQHATLTVRFGQANRAVEYPRSPMGAFALARQTMYDARWYMDAWRSARSDNRIAPPEQNASLAALEPLMRADQPLVVSCSNELMALRADRFAREFGIPLVLHGSGREYQRLDDVSALGRTIILPVDFPKPPAVGTREGALNASLESLLDWDFAPENPARLAAAGVPFAFCSHPLRDKEEFLNNVRRAIHRGLSRETALAALTTEPAKLFGAEGMLGTIEPGKLANILVLDGDFFEPKCKIEETWVAGKRFVHGPRDSANVVGVWELSISGDASPKTLKMKIEKSDRGFAARIVMPEDENDDERQEGESEEKKPETDAADPDQETEQPNHVPSDEKDDESTDENQKEREDKPESEIKNFTVHGNRISGSLDGKHLQTEGWIQLTLVIVGDEGQGQAVQADGTERKATTTRTAEKPDDEPSDESDEPSDEDEETEDSAESQDESEEKKSRGRRGDRGGIDPKKDLPASYPLHYPLGPFGVTELPAQPNLVAFRGATIWTCGSQGVVENATLVFGSGKIVAVLAADQAIPEGAEVIEAQNLHITPGIIDCHSHMATDSGVNEGGQAITAEVRIGDFVDCDDITIYRQLAGGVTAANILHGSANPIGGQNQVIKLRWGVNDDQMKFAEAPAGIKFALGENVKQSNRSDSTRTRYPQTRMGVEQIIDDEFRAARDYRHRQAAWKKTGQGLPPRTDLELEAIAEIVEGTRWIHCHSYRQDEILALIRVLDAHGITIGSFQHILEGYKVAEKMAEHGATASAFADWWAYKFEVYDAIPHAGALMHQAGLVVSFNSDDAELGRHLNQEAAKAVRYGGVEPAEALKFVTLNPAKQLRIDAYVGSLEPGKHADFVVWNAPPLSNLARPEQTWIDGRKFFDRIDDQQRQKDAAAMHQTLVQKILASGQEFAGDRNDSDDSGLWPRYDEYCHGHDHHDDE